MSRRLERRVADRELDRAFARNDEHEYDAPAPAQRHAKEDLGEFRHNLESHQDDLSPMQRAVMVETFFEERKRAEVAQCHGISPSRS
jgi:DNA-directed RNA polymerase specialized sigma24 family protein